MAQPRRTGRPDMRLVALVAAVALAVAVGVFIFLVRPSGGVVVQRASDTAPVTQENQGIAQTNQAALTSEPNAIVVHVDGAVASPGVYELAIASPRVRDAVDAAGGLAQGADTSSINLALPLGDGQKVHVPFEGEAAGAEADSSGGDAVIGSVSSSMPSLVNINSATAEELDSLPGVGPSTAAAIVEDRDANGPFSSVEDLMRVSGIGEKKFAKLRDHICV